MFKLVVLSALIAAASAGLVGSYGLAPYAAPFAHSYSNFVRTSIAPIGIRTLAAPIAAPLVAPLGLRTLAAPIAPLAPLGLRTLATPLTPFAPLGIRTLAPFGIRSFGHLAY